MFVCSVGCWSSSEQLCVTCCSLGSIGFKKSSSLCVAVLSSLTMQDNSQHAYPTYYAGWFEFSNTAYCIVLVTCTRRAMNVQMPHAVSTLDLVRSRHPVSMTPVSLTSLVSLAQAKVHAGPHLLLVIASSVILFRKVLLIYTLQVCFENEACRLYPKPSYCHTYYLPRYLGT